MNILVINCGSSSLKFSVIKTETGADLARGLCDKLGSDSPNFRFQSVASSLEQVGQLPAGAAHEESLDALAGFLERAGLKIDAVGHRVVHGGERFTSANLIDSEALEAIEACVPLAPLHNPANLKGIETSQRHFPALPQVAVFDTAFHQSLKAEAYLYPLPLELYQEHGIRRYGFHGSSHKYVAGEAAKLLGRDPQSTSLIIAHLGNGCSASAVENGRCVDTTMGLTPLEGLVMGTRSGDLDPGILLHLQRSLRMDVAAVDTLLNKKSGLLGLSQRSNDMRTLRAAAKGGDELARQAIAIFTRRLAKSLAALRATLHQCHAIIFTGGIGENDSATRAETLAYLSHLGVTLDAEANQNPKAAPRGIISTAEASTQVLVVNTNEELMIARETEQLVANLAK